jgi:hypothetical protein
MIAYAVTERDGRDWYTPVGAVYMYHDGTLRFRCDAPAQRADRIELQPPAGNCGPVRE